MCCSSQRVWDCELGLVGVVAFLHPWGCPPIFAMVLRSESLPHWGMPSLAWEVAWQQGPGFSRDTAPTRSSWARAPGTPAPPRTAIGFERGAAGCMVDVRPGASCDALALGAGRGKHATYSDIMHESNKRACAFAFGSDYPGLSARRSRAGGLPRVWIGPSLLGPSPHAAFMRALRALVVHSGGRSLFVRLWRILGFGALLD